jgi:hypothetical protein
MGMKKSKARTNEWLTDDDTGTDFFFTETEWQLKNGCAAEFVSVHMFSASPSSMVR